jgi:phage replication-related protein YjqB (UPF0714/DUF867 family)
MAYTSWAALVAAESTANYAIEINDQRSQWSAIAIHGDRLERLTADIARDVAAANRYSFYALNIHDTTVPANQQRLRISAPNFDEPQCLALQSNALYSMSIHAISDVAELPEDLGKIRVRGLDPTRQTRITEVLTAAGFSVVNKSEEGNPVGGERGDALDINNIVNKTRTARGTNIELDLTFRRTLVTDPDDLDSPKSALYTTFIDALADYLATYDKYNNWADLSANEVDGVDYETESISSASRWAHIAVHGGGIELMTASVAKAVAENETQKYWAFKGIKASNVDDLYMTATRFDNPDCVAMVSQSSYCVSYHGMTDDTAGTTTPTAFVGGLDTYNRDRVIAALNAKGIAAVLATKGEVNSENVNNIVNKTQSGRGVQIEMNRALRDSFLVSGNAADEGTSATTQTFTDFVDAVSSVVHEEAITSGDRPFDVGEFSTQVLGKEVTLTYNRTHQQAIQESTTGYMFFTQIISDGVVLPDESGPLPSMARDARGDICINKVDPSGNLVSKMWCRGFDHGASLGGVEVDGSGDYFLWLATDAAERPIGTNAYGVKICRIAYVEDKIYDKGDSDIDIYDVFPEGSERLAPSMDFANNRVGVYRRQNGIDSYRVYGMTEFRNKDFADPIWVMDNVAAPVVRQAWCLFGEYIYTIYGEAWSESNPKPPLGVGNTHFTIIHMPTAKLIEDHIRNTELALEKREPESVNIWNQLSGSPQLMYGWSVSDTNPRRCHMRVIGNRWPYRNWQELTDNEDPANYQVHEVLRGSNVSHLAIHGDLQELMTMALAQGTADLNGHEYFAVEGKKGTAFPDNNNLLRIPSTLFDHPNCVSLQNSVEYSWSYHGRANDLGDPADGIVYVGGLDTPNRQRTLKALTDRGFNAVDGGREGGGFGDQQYPANIVNRSVSGAFMAAAGMTEISPLLANGGGVQLELSRALRDRMSATGDASDMSEGTTEVFTDFIGAVAQVAADPSGEEEETSEERCIRYFINNYNLNQSQYGIKLMQGTEWASSISPRRFDLEIPMWHGQIPMWHDPLDTMKVTFEVEIKASTQSVLRQRYNDFVSLCGAGKWIPVLLERYRGIYLMSDTEHDPADNNKPYGEYAYAQLESLSAPEYDHPGMRLTTTVVFNVPVGQWRSHKVYTQTYNGPGSYKSVVAKVSSVPVYSHIIRVKGGPGGDRNIEAFTVVDQWSQTGVAWNDPTGINLDYDEWLYCNTENMRAYISKVESMPNPGESWSEFIERIDGLAAWSNFRYIRNGPLMLTHKLEWNEAAQALTHTSGVDITMTAIDGGSVAREMLIQARAANR